MGLLDEDSIDYVPIVSSESAKKMKLTDRQREIFSEKRLVACLMKNSEEKYSFFSKSSKSFQYK